MEEGPIAKFWSLGRNLQEEGKFKGALNQLLKEFRKTLDDSSPLAKSIDNNDSSETRKSIRILPKFCFWILWRGISAKWKEGWLSAQTV